LPGVARRPVPFLYTKEKVPKEGCPHVASFGFPVLLGFEGVGRQHFLVLTVNVRLPCRTPSGYSLKTCDARCDIKGIKVKTKTKSKKIYGGTPSPSGRGLGSTPWMEEVDCAGSWQSRGWFYSR
jgi:hypothetical protein